MFMIEEKRIEIIRLRDFEKFEIFRWGEYSTLFDR